MVDRIKKLKSRRGKFDEGSKVCKKCGKDFLEKENFNWSCSTHQSEFSGEMWWCCGKTQKEARGCKFSKHEKQDEDEEDEDNGGGIADQNKFNMKCRCCKEVGHQIESCPRDPNIRTLRTDIEVDYERIKKIKDYRKLYADTVVMTTQLLKKCVLVPIKQSEDQEKMYAEHPFKRGSMKFDDFNY